MPITLGSTHLSNTRTYEVQRTNNFEVMFDGLGQEFTLSVESCPFPTVSNDPIELSYGNSKVKVAGQANFENLSIVVKDAIGADIEMKLWEWRKKVYNPETDKVGWSVDYKKNGRVYQYAPDGTHIRTWKLIGAWPTNFNPGEGNYASPDKKTITMDISIDKAYPVR